MNALLLGKCHVDKVWVFCGFGNWNWHQRWFNATAYTIRVLYGADWLYLAPLIQMSVPEYGSLRPQNFSILPPQTKRNIESRHQTMLNESMAYPTSHDHSFWLEVKPSLMWFNDCVFLGSFFGIRSREEWKQHDFHIETWTNLYSFRKLLSTINMEKYSGNEKNKINYTIAKTAVKSIKRYASNSIYSKRSAKERISHMLIEIIGLHQRQKVGLRVIVHMPIT